MKQTGDDAAYPAPSAQGPVRGTVEVPGSKSMTNRALVLAALSDGPSTISGALLARDTSLMVDALRTLGVSVARAPGTPAVAAANAEVTHDGGESGAALRVVPGTLEGPAQIDCGLAGTVMRFVPPVAALARGDVGFDGDARARERPLAPLLQALRDLGVDISDDNRGTLPFTVRGTGHVSGGVVAMDASASSQFVSALLLSAARFDSGLTLIHRGPALPSAPFIELTCQMLRRHGVDVSSQQPSDGGRDLAPSATDVSAEPTWVVRPGPIAARDVRIEPDLSNALPFLAAAVVTGGTVRVPGWPTVTDQAGAVIPDLLRQFGAEVQLDDTGLSVSGPGKVSAVEVDLSDVGEIAPTMAAMALVADGPCRLRGISHLRGHETDRLSALVAEITRMGGAARELDDGLEIIPAPLHPTTVRTYEDHRMATFAAIVGLVVPGTMIENVQTTGKTMPGFVHDWEALVAGGET